MAWHGKETSYTTGGTHECISNSKAEEKHTSWREGGPVSTKSSRWPRSTGCHGWVLCQQSVLCFRRQGQWRRRSSKKWSYQAAQISQVAVVVESLADLLRHRLVHFHDRRLVTAAVAVVGGTEDRAHPLRKKKANATREKNPAWSALNSTIFRTFVA